ncbi:MAG: molybdopterin-binding protein [Geminicoccaceae bacterium]|nr:molybdopterin-binding protein [Elioraea sp.]MCX7630465.1 molybdopterin-binding protein [Geminicoccaceae bacterium]
MAETPTAAVLIIGNEILSGRTQDANLAHIARVLGTRGIRVREARVVEDDVAAIVEAVNALRARYTYVFTTGGIGPTHDDVTAQGIAQAFGRPLVRDPEAERRLLAFYPPEKRTPARMKMADVPQGAELVDNPVSAAPGFRVENVYVLPGVPVILQAMLDLLAPRLAGGPPLVSRTLVTYAPEGEIAERLAAVQARHPEVTIGSYPFMRLGTLGTSVVFRASDAEAVARAASDFLAVMTAAGVRVDEEVLA